MTDSERLETALNTLRARGYRTFVQYPRRPDAPVRQLLSETMFDDLLPVIAAPKHVFAQPHAVRAMGLDGEIRPLMEEDGSATDAIFLSWWPDKAEVVGILRKGFGSRVVDDSHEWTAIEVKAASEQSQQPGR